MSAENFPMMFDDNTDPHLIYEVQGEITEGVETKGSAFRFFHNTLKWFPSSTIDYDTIGIGDFTKVIMSDNRTIHLAHGTMEEPFYMDLIRAYQKGLLKFPQIASHSLNYLASTPRQLSNEIDNFFSSLGELENIRNLMAQYNSDQFNRSIKTQLELYCIPVFFHLRKKYNKYDLTEFP